MPDRLTTDPALTPEDYTVPLPRASDMTAAHCRDLAHSHSCSGGPPLTRHRIMIVDDSFLDAELTCLALREQGLHQTVHVALGGQQALDYLMCCPALHLPELLLLDLNMPGVDGLAVLAHVRATPALAALRVVILTTSTGAGDREACLRGGADDVVQKSAHLSDFIQAMREVTRDWLEQRPDPALG